MDPACLRALVYKNCQDENRSSTDATATTEISAAIHELLRHGASVGSCIVLTPLGVLSTRGVLQGCSGRLISVRHRVQYTVVHEDFLFAFVCPDASTCLAQSPQPMRVYSLNLHTLLWSICSPRSHDGPKMGYPVPRIQAACAHKGCKVSAKSCDGTKAWQVSSTFRLIPIVSCCEVLNLHSLCVGGCHKHLLACSAR